MAAARAAGAATEEQEADGLSADAAAGEERLGDTPAEPAPAALSPSQDGSGPADVPSGSAGAEHGGSKEPSSRGLENLGGERDPAVAGGRIIPTAGTNPHYELGGGEVMSTHKNTMGATGASSVEQGSTDKISYEPHHGVDLNEPQHGPNLAAVSEETAGESPAFRAGPHSPQTAIYASS